jgi:predicted O-methyltransferase YrrM
MDQTTSYIASFLALDNDYLTLVAAQEDILPDVRPSIGPQAGRFLGLLVRLVRAERVLELGTSLGYSAIWLGEALRETGGRLISVEVDAELFRRARQNVLAAGLSDVVELVLGDAPCVVEALEGPFDLILQDSDKALYPHLLERCIDLTRLYGVIVADDALFQPLGRPDRLSAPIDQYNHKVFSDPRLYSSILPIGDGLTLSVKVES